MASGIPSSRRQISAMASTSAPGSKSGATARARTANSSAAVEFTPTSSDATREVTSPAMPNASRLVVRTVTSGQRARSCSTSRATSSSTCSQLSNTSRSCRARSASVTRSGQLTAASGATENTDATASATSPPSRIGASSMSQQPSRWRSDRAAASCSASRVFPIPPTPTRVTIRFVLSDSSSVAISDSRPTKLVAWTGRLPGTTSSVFSGGRSVTSPGAVTWKIATGSDRSLSRRSPRSTRSKPSASAAVDAATRI